MTGWLARALAVDRLRDEDDIWRARLIVIAAAAITLYLVATAAVSAVGRGLAMAVVSAALAALAAAACALARSGRLPAAEWATAAFVACGSAALIAMQGPMAERLGAIQVGIVLLGLVVRPWIMLAQVLLAVVLVRGGQLAGFPSPLAPSTTPAWLTLAELLPFTTALVVVFTHGYRRSLAALAQRSAKLAAAHDELIAARDRLEQLVSARTTELEHAATDLEAFASAVAHDLQAPLRHVRQFLAMFTEDAHELGEARLAPITAVQLQAAELTARIEAILAASRGASHHR